MGPTCVLLFPLYLSVCYPLRHARIPKTISGFLDFGPNRRYGWTVPIHDSADSVTKFKLATWFFSCFWQIISQEIKLKIWWSCILLESSACALAVPSNRFRKNGQKHEKKKRIWKWHSQKSFVDILVGPVLGVWGFFGRICWGNCRRPENQAIGKSRSRFGGIRTRL